MKTFIKILAAIVTIGIGIYLAYKSWPLGGLRISAYIYLFLTIVLGLYYFSKKVYTVAITGSLFVVISIIYCFLHPFINISNFLLLNIIVGIAGLLAAITYGKGMYY